jgi:pSer/pThr/pTyr-binding forkhead associated (FHA) protein
MSNVAIFKNFETPKETGTYFRLLCLNGRTKGVSYYLTGKRVIIGRGEKTDIQLFDIKSSREHAEISIIGNDIIITDLGSQNGITVNDLKIKQHKLKDQDKLIVGQTVFKFGKIKVDNEDKKKKIKLVEESDLEEGSKGKRKLKPIIIVVILAGLYFMLSGDSKDGTSGNRVGVRNKNLFKQKTLIDDFSNEVNKKKHYVDKGLKRKLKGIFQKGLREYREGNYFRAMNEFKKALILKPDDGQANFYLRKSKDALDEVIKEHIDKGDRDFASLKYRSAKAQFCAIMRILTNYSENERYKNAESRIREIEKAMGMDKGEIKCI